MTNDDLKNEIKVSVIMSLFNVEKYMKVAIDSVLNQTLQDIELICINDGSVDNSLQIALEYAEKDSRVTVLTYEDTKGQAYARNRGMDIAKGKYIGYVDGDDWVEPDMFEKLYNDAEKNGSEISFCGAALYDELIQKYDYKNVYYNLDLIPTSFDNKVFHHSETKSLLTGCINVALWNKIYRTDFMNKYNIRFPQYFIYEDMPFFYDAWFKADKISMIRDCCYYYRINRSGSTMAKVGSKVLDRVEMVALTYEMFKELPYYEEIKTQVNSWIIDDLFHRYTLVEAKYKKEFFFLMKKLFKNLDLENVDTEELSKCYCYKEYSNCLSMKYDTFTSSLTDTYVRAKKEKQELLSSRRASNYKIQVFYEDIIQKIKDENELNMKTQEAWVRDGFNERLREIERRMNNG